MTSFESVAVPFRRFGNRRGFTAQQLHECPVAADFYARFKHCFEDPPNVNFDVVLFIEPRI